MSTPPPRARQIQALTDVSRALTTAASFDEVLQLVAERAAQMLDAPASVLMLADDDGQLTIRAAVGLAPEKQRVRHAVDHTLIEELQHALGVDAERFISVPLVASGQVTGLVAVALREGTPSHGDEEEWLLSALADQAAIALEKTRLDERGRMRDRLIGIVSHDLRGPINTVLLGASLLLDNDALDPGARKTVARITSAAQRAGRMIGDLLDYTQASLGGGIRVERVPCNLGLIVRGVVDELASTDHSFEVLEHGDTAARLDADRIAQVVGNLLANALKYRRPDTTIRIEVGGDATCVSVSVHNLGIAIPAERLRNIFEPMHQLEPGAGRSEHSIGLGLYIVDSIVTAHAGSITVASTVTEGTRFTVLLPRELPVPAT